MTLLPPNMTEPEKDVVESIHYPIDPAVMRGFKFHPPDSFLAALIWEYGLGELLRWLPDPRRAIAEGVQWQRIRGTPESLKIALSWAGLEGVYVEEEVPGEHFAEFQVGAEGNVPNDLFIDVVIELAKLSAPIRTRLTRMYNDRYDVRRFILDQSQWGDLLSDYSGNRLSEDGPVLSFGRFNAAFAEAPKTELLDYHDHHSWALAVLPDTYRLDQVQLGVSEPHVINHRGGYGRIYSAANLHGISLSLDDISDVYRFAKAEIVLSDSWVLGDINACFAPAETIETGQAFTLNESLLSEEQWTIQAIPIDERFLRSHEAKTEGAFDDPVIGGFSDMFRISRYDEQIRWPRLSDKHAVADAPQPIIVKTHVGNGQYRGVDGWHDHQHLDRPWRDISHIISRMTYRQSVTSDPEPYSDQHITSQGVSEYLGTPPVSNFEASDVLHDRGSVFEDAAYRYADGWHGYMHLNQPWNETQPIVQGRHTQTS